MPKPRISVIVPCRDEVASLERTLCSVLDQDYENLELLVADGGSTDDTQDVIEQYADQLAWWHSGPDTGPADAVNLAMRHVTGEFVGILHAGDLYVPGSLDAIAERINAHDVGRCDWVVGHCVCVDERDNERGRIEAAMPRSAAGFLMHDSGLLPPSAVFYRRSLLGRHGPFDVRFRFAWEYEMHARLITADRRPTILSQVLVTHNEADESADRMQRTLRLGAEFIEVAERFGEHLPMKQQYTLWRNCDERRRIYALAEAEMQAGMARRHLWQRLLRRPWWLASQTYRRMLLQRDTAQRDEQHDEQRNDHHEHDRPTRHAA